MCKVLGHKESGVILTERFFEVSLRSCAIVADASSGAICGLGDYLLGVWTASDSSQVCTHVQMRVLRGNNDRHIRSHEADIAMEQTML